MQPSFLADAGVLPVAANRYILILFWALFRNNVPDLLFSILFRIWGIPTWFTSSFYKSAIYPVRQNICFHSFIIKETAGLRALKKRNGGSGCPVIKTGGKASSPAFPSVLGQPRRPLWLRRGALLSKTGPYRHMPSSHSAQNTAPQAASATGSSPAPR